MNIYSITLLQPLAQLREAAATKAVDWSRSFVGTTWRRFLIQESEGRHLIVVTDGGAVKTGYKYWLLQWFHRTHLRGQNCEIPKNDQRMWEIVNIRKTWLNSLVELTFVDIASEHVEIMYLLVTRRFRFLIWRNSITFYDWLTAHD